MSASRTQSGGYEKGPRYTRNPDSIHIPELSAHAHQVNDHLAQCGEAHWQVEESRLGFGLEEGDRFDERI